MLGSAPQTHRSEWKLLRLLSHLRHQRHRRSFHSTVRLHPSIPAPKPGKRWLASLPSCRTLRGHSSTPLSLKSPGLVQPRLQPHPHPHPQPHHSGRILHLQRSTHQRRARMKMAPPLKQCCPPSRRSPPPPCTLVPTTLLCRLLASTMIRWRIRCHPSMRLRRRRHCPWSTFQPRRLLRLLGSPV